MGLLCPAAPFRYQWRCHASAWRALEIGFPKGCGLWQCSSSLLRRLLVTLRCCTPLLIKHASGMLCTSAASHAMQCRVCLCGCRVTSHDCPPMQASKSGFGRPIWILHISGLLGHFLGICRFFVASGIAHLLLVRSMCKACRLCRPSQKTSVLDCGA